MAKSSKAAKPQLDWQAIQQDVDEHHNYVYSARSMATLFRTSVTDPEHYGLEYLDFDGQPILMLEQDFEDGKTQQAMTTMLCTMDDLKARVTALAMALQTGKPLIGIGLKMKSAPVKARAIKAAIDKANYDEIKCALQAELDANPHNSLTQARHRLANLQDEDGNPIYAGYSTVKKATKGMKGPQKKKK